MVTELVTRRCASEDAGPPRGWIVRFQIDWREDETFLIRVWKPLPSRLPARMLENLSIVDAF